MDDAGPGQEARDGVQQLLGHEGLLEERPRQIAVLIARAEPADEEDGQPRVLLEHDLGEAGAVDWIHPDVRDEGSGRRGEPVQQVYRRERTWGSVDVVAPVPQGTHHEVEDDRFVVHHQDDSSGGWCRRSHGLAVMGLGGAIR
jgi:hypothetical protein